MRVEGTWHCERCGAFGVAEAQAPENEIQAVLLRDIEEKHGRASQGRCGVPANLIAFQAVGEPQSDAVNVA